MNRELVNLKPPKNPEKNGSATRSDRSKAIVLTISLVVLALAGNSIGTTVFWNPNIDAEQLLCFVLGMLIAQPCLVAIWFALGIQKFIVRAPLTVCILLLLVAGYVQTLFLLDGNQGMPMEVPLIALCIALSLFLLIIFPLWIYRIATKHVISQRHLKSRLGEEQFGIKHLLIATTIAAVLVGVGRYAIPDVDFSGVPIGQIVSFLLPFIATVSLLSYLSCAFVFLGRMRLLIGITIGSVIIVVPVVMFYFQPNWIFSGVEFTRAAANTFMFLLSLAATMLAVLFGYYSIGFRLKRTV